MFNNNNFDFYTLTSYKYCAVGWCIFWLYMYLLQTLKKNSLAT